MRWLAAIAATLTLATPAHAGLGWSSFLGGAGDDAAYAVAHDANGDVLVAGTTSSTDFPTTAGAYQRTHAAYSDVFVARLHADGSVAWSTLLGGGGPENAMAVAVDGSGNVYVTGNTCSRDFPVTASAFQKTFAGGQYDGFVAKFSAAGTLLYSTYLGGNQDDVPLAVAVDGAGDAFIAGFAVSTNFPTTSGVVKPTHAGMFPDAGDGFVTKLDPTGSRLVYSTYLGTEGGTDEVFGLALDANGRATVCGTTESRAFPVTSGVVRPAYSGGWDGFVTQLSATGSSYVFSTYLNGTGDDTPTAVAVDANNNVFVAGRTYSPNFPTTAGAAQTAFGGGTWDGFAVELNPAATSFVYGTYLGGGASDMAWSAALTSTGQLCVTGASASSNFPVSSGAYDASANGGDDAFVTVLSATGAIAYSSWLGGAGADAGRGVTVLPGDVMAVSGQTASAGFPVAAAWDGSFGGVNDGFLCRIDATASAPPPPPPPPTPTVSASSNGPVCAGSSLCLTAAGSPSGGTYRWTGPNGFTSTQQGPCITNAQAVNAGSYCVTYTVSGVASQAACTSPVVQSCAVTVNCPRAATFWEVQAESHTQFTTAQVTQVATCANDRSSFFAWAAGSEAASFAAVLDSVAGMDVRRQAKRQFAGLLANVCARSLGMTAVNGDAVGIDATTRIAISGYTSTTIGAWLGELDGILAANEGGSLRKASAKNAYRNLAAAAGAVNGGIGIGSVCGSAGGVTAQGGDVPEPSVRVDAGTFQLYGSWPNPFTNSTRLQYVIGTDTAERVHVEVLDVTGRHVATLLDEPQVAGRHEVSWDGRTDAGEPVAKGMYLVLARIAGEQRLARVIRLP